MRNWEVAPLDWAIARESTWEGELVWEPRRWGEGAALGVRVGVSLVARDWFEVVRDHDLLVPRGERLLCQDL